MRLWPVLTPALVVLFAGSVGARAQVSDDVVKIGVMNDQSGLYADLGGPGSVTAARKGTLGLLHDSRRHSR